MFKKKLPGDAGMIGGVRKKGKSGKLEELVLPNAKLRFCPEQLQNLNFIFNKRLQKIKDACNDKSLALAKSVTERLVQRLLSSVGSLDPRFASKFLIRNDDEGNISSNTLDYIVRLDCLSTPSLYESDAMPRYSVIEGDTDCPAAYARLKLQAHTLKTWSDFVNGNGYLRRYDRPMLFKQNYRRYFRNKGYSSSPSTSPYLFTPFLINKNGNNQH
ncbi:unnamed protein product [Acanthoscelides obtectus]|uniref:Uncharacterized protein n=1 Tax=Acanthoscelides obtectus TaxID=200917 RepID=A0A9P0JMK7_ACAOB|nr:unnamed protein product [Acanthoscelides obtectus]CAK1665708.1 hypothetical protein AOBTE_LOCUS24927 [Acanthoscelides obtectus]